MEKPLWAFASGPHGGDRERIILPLHVYKIVNGLLAGQNVVFWQSLFHYQGGQWNHLVAKNEKACKRNYWKSSSKASKFCDNVETGSAECVTLSVRAHEAPNHTVAHRLHVKDGGLGDDHWPVSGVTLQLGFGPLYRKLPRRIVVGLWHGHEPVLPHELTKILKLILGKFWFNADWSKKRRGRAASGAPWCGSLSLCPRSPRWLRAGPPGWSGCCWGRVERSRPRGCWACGWWPLTLTSSAVPAAPIDLGDEFIVFKFSAEILALKNLPFHFTIEEKVCQTRWRATVYVCRGDAIRSSAVMQLWNSRTDDFSDLIFAYFFLHVSLQTFRPASTHRCCCCVACTTSAWPSLSVRFLECWCRPCVSLLLKTERHYYS